MTRASSLIEFQSREAMAERLSDFIEAALAQAISADGRAELAVSGGSTPDLLHRSLARRPLNWPLTNITLVDERWVPADHPRSNEAFVRASFAGADTGVIRGLYRSGASPDVAASEIQSELRAIGKSFDVVLLGLGPDGHTASWFPHATGLDMALRSDAAVCAIRAEKTPVTGDEIDRLTLTLTIISAARRIILLMAGQEKRDAFEAAAAHGPEESMPVRAILRARPDIWACWAP